MKKSLLITADDYGVHDTIDDGIIRCLHNIDCIDIIVTHDSSKRRIQNLITEHGGKIKNGEIKLGLHLNLNVGKPLYRDPNSEVGKKYLRIIAKAQGRMSDEGSEFKHKHVTGIMLNIKRIILHKEALKEEIRCQFNAFKEYTGGMVPAHVSSHSGVFSGHPKMYELLKEVCLELDNLPIRCPSLIAYDLYRDDYNDLERWSKYKQYLLTESQLNQMKFIPGGSMVRQWMLNGQRVQFDVDLKNKEVVSTEFFVPHFYLQGESTHFNKIIKLIKDNDHPREHSYEMVVHPLHFDRKTEYANMPRGIKINDVHFMKRKKECKTLSLKSNHWRDKARRSGIDVYSFP